MRKCSKEIENYIREICCEKNCVKFDSSVLDKRLASAKSFEELQEISISYDDGFQHKKALAIWEDEYKKYPGNVDVILMFAECLMDNYQTKSAVQMFLKVFAHKRRHRILLIMWNLCVVD